MTWLILNSCALIGRHMHSAKWSVLPVCALLQKKSKFSEFISPAEVALVCLKFKFHKILFTCY